MIQVSLVKFLIVHFHQQLAALLMAVQCQPNFLDPLLSLHY